MTHRPRPACLSWPASGQSGPASPQIIILILIINNIIILTSRLLGLNSRWVVATNTGLLNMMRMVSDTDSVQNVQSSHSPRYHRPQSHNEANVVLIKTWNVFVVLDFLCITFPGRSYRTLIVSQTHYVDNNTWTYHGDRKWRSRLPVHSFSAWRHDRNLTDIMISSSPSSWSSSHLREPGHQVIADDVVLPEDGASGHELGLLQGHDVGLVAGDLSLQQRPPVMGKYSSRKSLFFSQLVFCKFSFCLTAV